MNILKPIRFTQVILTVLCGLPALGGDMDGGTIGESWETLERDGLESTQLQEPEWKTLRQKYSPVPELHSPPEKKGDAVHDEKCAVVLGGELYSFKAVRLELKSALALFAEANGLNIACDSDVAGEVTLDIRKLPLDQLMQALLESHDCWWERTGMLIRVRTTRTQSYSLDYLRLHRKGVGHNSATLAAASTGAATGTSSNTGGNGNGGVAGSTVNLSAENHIDFWKELRVEVERLLTPAGRDSLAINPTAGLLQVTDRPSAHRRLDLYLHGISKSIQRQIDIEARLYDITLNDQFQFGVDWDRVVETSAGAFTMGAAPSAVRPMGGFDLAPDSFNLVFQGKETRAVLRSLQEQGEVKVVSKPRLRTLNNQTALIKVGTETPFFQSTSTLIPGAGTTSGTSAVIGQDSVSTVTVGTILSITPQVAEDDWVSLDVSPVLTSLLETRLSPNKTTTAPVLDIKQASTLIRIRSGSTAVLGGLIQTESALSRRKIPGLGDIPLLGRMFQGEFKAHRKKELVIFITPRIVD